MPTNPALSKGNIHVLLPKDRFPVPDIHIANPVTSRRRRTPAVNVAPTLPTFADVRFYPEMGWPIFPCVVNGKAPLTPNGFEDATTNISRLIEWAARWPGCNWATVPGETGHMVVDFDPGATMEPPVTPLVTLTPRGAHYWLALLPGVQVPSSASRIAPHVDVRSSGGYVLLPPSVTPDGVYRWKHEVQS